MSYDPAEATDTDVVRGLIGDTSNDVTTEYLADATISAILVRQTSVYLAAAECADRIAAIVARRPESVSIGDQTVTRAQRPQAWHDLAEALRARAADAAAADAGGLFDWAEMVTGPFSARERLEADRLRTGGD